ncbi:transcriptional regulator [Tistrella mobilis]|uniref:Transcriptional regulator n=2 Tax=Tistrella mobilis TaxID=171437 RepID=A0A162JVQ6_9PROT|nr:transcriptional regulator [Tistrella mobilis]
MTGAAEKRPRTKPAEIRRDELMDAAEALFLRKGFATTSVGEIVVEAGVAKGTFYLYFKTKDDVLDALRTRFIEGFCEKLDMALAAADRDWPDRIDIWVRTSVNAWLDSVARHDLVFHQHAPANREMKADNLVILRLASLLEQGAQAGAWTIDHPRLIAVMLFDALHGAVDDHLASKNPVGRATLIGLVTSFYRRALALAHD